MRYAPAFFVSLIFRIQFVQVGFERSALIFRPPVELVHLGVKPYAVLLGKPGRNALYFGGDLAFTTLADVRVA